MTLHKISKTPQRFSPLVTIVYQAELPGKREAGNGTRFTNVRQTLKRQLYLMTWQCNGKSHVTFRRGMCEAIILQLPFQAEA